MAPSGRLGVSPQEKVDPVDAERVAHAAALAVRGQQFLRSAGVDAGASGALDAR